MISGELNHYAEKAMIGEACKPDPEEMLQRARKRIEQCEKAESLLVQLEESRVNIQLGENGHLNFMIALGSIRKEYLQTKQEEQHWLDEINKD